MSSKGKAIPMTSPIRDAVAIPKQVVRRGLWLIPIGAIAGGVLFMAGVLAPTLKGDLSNARDFTQGATGTAVVSLEFLFLVSLMALGLGLYALYAALAGGRSERPGLIGLICGTLSMGFLLAAYSAGMLATIIISNIYLSGHPEVAAALPDFQGGQFGRAILVTFVLGIALALVAAIAYGVAIARAGMPRWMAIVFGLGLVLFAASFPGATQLGAILLAVAGIKFIRSPVVVTAGQSR